MLSDTMMLGGGRKAAYSLENSLLFRGGQYLRWTPSVSGNQKKWTYSGWVRLGGKQTHEMLSVRNGSSGIIRVTSSADGSRFLFYFAGTPTLATTPIFRDCTGWVHFVLAVDTGLEDAVADKRVRLYVNGVEIKEFALSNYPAQNAIGPFNSVSEHYIGRNEMPTYVYSDGYQAETCFVDGAALGPSHFGEFDVVTGNWAPKRVPLNTQLPTYRGNLVPRMTGYEAPSGKVQASNDGSSPAWRAFNQSSDPTDGWQTTAGVGWISYAPAVPVIVSAYSIQVTTTDPANRSPKSWTFEGYNGSAWVVLDTQSNVPVWKGQEKRLYTFSNGTAYSSYRLNISALQGGATIVSIKAIEFFSSVETSPYGANGFHLGTPFVKDNVGRDYSGLSGASFLVKPSGSAASLSTDGLTWAYGGANSYARGAHAFDAASATGVRFSFKFVSGTSQGAMVGICAANIVGATPSLSGEMYSYRFYNGEICGDGGYASRPGSISFSAGDVLDVVVQAGALYFYRNGSKLDGGLANGAWKTGLSGHWCPFVDRDSQVAISVQFNAGAVAWDYTIETTASGVVGGNDWMPNGFAASDVVADSPTNVYAVLNPLTCGSYPQLVDGNLVLNASAGGDLSGCGGTLFAVRGKWYWEVRVKVGATYPYVGVTSPARLNYHATYGSHYEIAKRTTGLEQASSLLSGVVLDSTGNQTWADDDVVMLALDCDAGKLWFGKNGQWMNGGDPMTGGNAQASWTNRGVPLTAYVGGVASQGAGSTANFGQRPFAYAPPSGFKALCTANLPATSGVVSGAFTGNAAADGPCVYTGAVPQSLTINGNAVIWGTHADRLATGFKIRTSAVGYNGSGSNTWVATYDRKPTVGGRGRAPANAQAN